MIGIFFFRPTLGGGTTSFTAHLFRALVAAGASPMIYRVTEKGGSGATRQFGQYEGVCYDTITVAEARKIVKEMPTVMGAPANVKFLAQPNLIRDLVKRGMRPVIHDTKEFSIYDDNRRVVKMPRPPICIRPTIREFYTDAVWIPHPYQRVDPEYYEDVQRRLVGVSTARIASSKRPRMLIEANVKLPKKLRIDLRGAEYRMYTWNLQKKYPGVFKQRGGTFGFPMTFEGSTRVCAEAVYNFDMTYFEHDGGGTQYCQLEAWDAGTVNVMNKDWFRFSGEVKAEKHVIAVESAADIVKLIRDTPRPSMVTDRCGQIIENGYQLLKRHAPRVVGRQYLEELSR
jgi:hypothetical protein